MSPVQFQMLTVNKLLSRKLIYGIRVNKLLYRSWTIKESSTCMLRKLKPRVITTKTCTNLNLFRAQQLYNSYKLFLGARRNGKRPSRIKKTAVYPGGQFTQEATSSVCPRVYAGEGDRPIDLSLHA